MKNLKNMLQTILVIGVLVTGCGEGREAFTGELGTSAQALSAYAAVYGDLTGDGQFDVTDAQCLNLTIHAVAGDDAMPACLSSSAAADLNCDGEINVTDYNLAIYKTLDNEAPLNVQIDANQNGVHDSCEATYAPEPMPGNCGGTHATELGPETACCPGGSVNYTLVVTPIVDEELEHTAFELGYPDEDAPRVVLVVRGLTKASYVDHLTTLLYDRLQCPNAPGYLGKHTWAKIALLQEITHGLAAFESTCGARLGRGIINVLFGPRTNKENNAGSPASCIDKQLSSLVKREASAINLDRRYLAVRRGAKAKSKHLSALVSFPHLIGEEGCEDRGDCIPGQIAQTAQIESVTLAMYARQGTAGYGMDAPWEAHLINADVAPIDMLWGDVQRTAANDTVELLDQVHTDGKYTNFDITAGVEQWQADPASNNGVLLDTAQFSNAYHGCTPHNWLNPSVLRGHHLPLVIVRYAD